MEIIQCSFCNLKVIDGPIGNLCNFYMLENIIACDRCLNDIVREAYESELKILDRESK